MPDIKYVVLSDMHLGAENSLLTNLKNDTPQTDTTHPSPVMVGFVDCLRELISKNESKEKPKLVLNGDLIELALTSTNRASMAFQRFIELIFPENGEFLFDPQILFLPGNHDHNLWEFARNSWYLETLKNLKPGDYIPNELHSTKVFEPPEIQSVFLTALIRSYPHLQNISVDVSYPAHGLINKDHSQCVVFCHGHYVESMYSLMSSLRADIFPGHQPPATLEDIEIENYAWVDFFWSTLGRSGSVGRDISLIYDKLQDSKQVKVMIGNIANSLTKKTKSAVFRALEKKALQIALNLSLGHMASSERNEPEVELTPDATEGLKRFMEVLLHSQLSKELQNDIPDDLTFIFGHTHKPFQRWFTFEGYPNPVKVYNTGGWVVDTLKPQPLHGGSIVLVDEELDVVSLSMYKEGRYSPAIEHLHHEHTAQSDVNTFYERLLRLVKENTKPWEAFEKIVEHEVKVRYINLAESIAGREDDH